MTFHPDAATGSSLAGQRPRASVADYVAIARPDHWVKHIFIVPGIALAYVLVPDRPGFSILTVLLGFVSAAAIASANYVINEWLDAEFDAHHPTKSRRPAVAKTMSPAAIYAEYCALSLFGLAVAWLVSAMFFAVSIAFLVSGLMYNVQPLRTKDKVYVDVITESVNNPIRLMLGWAMIDPGTVPPSSLLLSYWMGGAFLMTVKRFAEYRSIVMTHGPEVLHLYRRSFRYYTEKKLLIVSFLYAQMAVFFLAVFLIKYRVEYLISFPFFALLFATYLWIGLKQDSTAQAPERLMKEPVLVGVVGVLVIVFLGLTFIDLPFLTTLYDPVFLDFTWGGRGAVP